MCFSSRSPMRTGRSWNSRLQKEQHENSDKKEAEPKTGRDGDRLGGGRNAKKANIDRVDENKKNETNARKDVQRLKSLPVNQRPPTYAKDLQRAQGALNRAIDKQKKSETDSRKTKKH